MEAVVRDPKKSHIFCKIPPLGIPVNLLIHFPLPLECLYQSFYAALRLPILGYTVVFPFRYALSRGCSSRRLQSCHPI